MSDVNRRDFLKIIGAGGVGTGAGFMLAEVSKMTKEVLMPQVEPPEDYQPGIATWYTTVCDQCAAGCGVKVRIREGRAKIVEGNAAHPVSAGGVCSLGLGSLNAQYNPDRIPKPLKLSGPRGSGSYSEITWEEAIGLLGDRIAGLKSSGQGGKVHLLTGSAKGHLDVLWARFMQSLGSDNYRSYEPTAPLSQYVANKLCFDENVLPQYDIANTRFLLSFGADYLGPWLSPVQHGAAYGQLRRGANGERGICVQIESRMSLSGANADRWVACEPGSEGLLALAIAHTIANGAYQGADREPWIAALAAYSPAAVAAQTGVSEELIAHLADDLMKHRPSLAIGGGAAASGPNAVGTLVAINALNYLAGNLGVKGGVLFNPDPLIERPFADRRSGYRQMAEYAQSLGPDSVDVLLINGTNPLYSLPPAAGLADAIAKVPFIASLSSFMDETTAQADLILPLDTFLESWGDAAPEPGVGAQVAAIAQPVVTRLHDTQGAGDIVLALARKLGGEVAAALPWPSQEAFIKDSWKNLYARQLGGTDKEFEAYWAKVLEKGIWGEAQAGANRPPKGNGLLAQVSALNLTSMTTTFNGNAAELPFVLQPYLTLAYADGRGANLPWMQELPDPLTSIVYNSWVELNPVTAKEMGLQEGDELEIKSSLGSIKAAVFMYPGIHPGVVAMPLGQGHTHYGRYAQNRGVNPLLVVAGDSDPASGALALTTTRVSVTRTGKRIRLAKTDGVTRTLGRQILGDGPAHG